MHRIPLPQRELLNGGAVSACLATADFVGFL